MDALLLIVITLGVGTFASLVGVGGGFLLMPVLLFLYPSLDQETLTLISLCAVLANGIAATVHYGRMKWIDYKTGMIMGACTIPTAIAARFALQGIDRSQFSRVFGVVLIVIGCFILWRVIHKARKGHQEPVVPKPIWLKRRIVTSTGDVHEYAYDVRFAAGTGVASGFLASFFGIGGGVLVVPVLTQCLYFPAHVATSTSVMILSVSALAAVLTDLFQHAAGGTLGDFPITLALAGAAGAVMGAQIGPRLSKRIGGERILSLLSIAIIIAGGRLVLIPNHSKPSQDAAPDKTDAQFLDPSTATRSVEAADGETR